MSDKLARSVLVTGCNRGLGLELAKQLASQTDILIVTCRDPGNALELQRLAKENEHVHILALDVTKHESFDSFAGEVSSIVGLDGLNLLINNAGMLHWASSGGPICTDMFAETFAVNTIAPLMLTKALLPILKSGSAASLENKYSLKNSVVVNMSSRVGSIEDNTSGSTGGIPLSYRCSKVALNMVSKSLSIDLLPAKITVISLHPGWVKTDMGGENAPLTPTTSVGHMIATMHQITAEKSGQFLNYDGKPIPW